MAKEIKKKEQEIERYAGLKGIRKRSNSYIGPNDENGLWTCIREPLDNCVDLALKGLNKSVHLILDKEPGVYWIVDTGPGFPVAVKSFDDEHGKPEKLNTLYVATGLVHSGSNFKDEEISRGVHGIGIKASNAMAKRFDVWTFYKDEWWSIHYKDAAVDKQAAKSKAPKLPHGLKAKSGTFIRVEPDLKLFMKGTKINGADVKSWFDLTAYLVPGIVCKMTDMKGKTREIKHPGGPKDYVAHRLEELKATAKPKIFLHQSPLLDIALAFSDAEGDNVKAYTNGLYNKDGGEHVRAVMDGMFASLKDYWPKQKKGDKGAPFKVGDLADGLLGLVNCKVAAPKFNNQPKDKLIDERVYDKAKTEATEAWTKFWSANKSLAKELVQRAVDIRSKTNSFLKDKKLIKNVKDARKGLSSKLAAIQGNAPVNERELFFVEGDSAAGGLIRMRDKRTQAIFPLKGKPLNVIDTKQEKVNSNAETVGIIAALDMDLDSKKSEPAIAYGKVCTLADADVDGSHINTLLLATLWKYAPHLIENGNVYAVRSPLFKAKHKGQIYFGMTKAEIYKQAGTDKAECTYLKGWGELNDDELEIAIKPGVRTLIKIGAPNKEQAKEFHALMGADTSYRKKMLGVANEEAAAKEAAKSEKKEKPAKADKKKKGAKNGKK